MSPEPRDDGLGAGEQARSVPQRGRGAPSSRGELGHHLGVGHVSKPHRLDQLVLDDEGTHLGARGIGDGVEQLEGGLGHAASSPDGVEGANDFHLRRDSGVDSSAMKALPIVLVVLVLGVGACLLVGWALLRVGAAATEPVPSSVELEDFDGELGGRWRAVEGGFTGDEAETPLDADLSAQWPTGSVVELSILQDGRYQLTEVRSTGSGPSLDRILHREEGRWSLAAGVLTLNVERGTVVRRHHGERTASPVEPRQRTFGLKARVAETAGAPGASPTTTEELQLSGDCVVGGGRCEHRLSLD